MRDALPKEVLTKKKMAFNPPLPQWLNGELKRSYSSCYSGSCGRRGIFRPDAVQSLSASMRKTSVTMTEESGRC